MRKAASAGYAAQLGMSFNCAYAMPAAASTTQPISRAARKPAGSVAIGLILAFVIFIPSLSAQEPPANLAKLVAQRETATQAERNEYTYRQTVTLDEMDAHGAARGQYREVRDIVFSPTRERSETVIGKPVNNLKSLIMTDEDFRDIRDIQPLVLTEDRLWNYESKFRGEEMIDGVDCWVLHVRPRQILEGQRFFDGLIWADKKEYNIVRMEGQAVPQIRTTKTENLFPRFATIRKQIDAQHWFPVHTYADDTLHFRTGPLRERLQIVYSNYKKFGAESTFRPEVK